MWHNLQEIQSTCCFVMFCDRFSTFSSFIALILFLLHTHFPFQHFLLGYSLFSFNISGIVKPVWKIKRIAFVVSISWSVTKWKRRLSVMSYIFVRFCSRIFTWMFVDCTNRVLCDDKYGVCFSFVTAFSTNQSRRSGFAEHQMHSNRADAKESRN